MKKILIATAALLMAASGWSQPYIHGSIQQGSSASKVDIMFLPEFTNPGGGAQYITFMQFAIAVPSANNATLTATFTPSAAFSGLSFTPQTPYDFGGERIYNWVCVNGGGVQNMSWTNGVSFAIGTITFANGGAPANVKLVDLTNQGGDGNTFFVITLSSGNDPTQYGDPFYEIAGGNGSTKGNYGATGDTYVQTNLLISLPVNMINFSGYKNGSKNTLNWTVASEVSNRGFEVERSTDGVNFSSIGFVNSQVGGYTNAEQHYSFDDNNPVAAKKQYYRLNQKDIDGNGKLSNVVLITGSRPSQVAVTSVFPNPTKNQVNLLIESPKIDKLILIVTDMSGKTVAQQAANVNAGSNTILMNMEKLASGSYLVKVVCENLDCEVVTTRFTKF